MVICFPFHAFYVEFIIQIFNSKFSQQSNSRELLFILLNYKYNRIKNYLDTRIVVRQRRRYWNKD